MNTMQQEAHDFERAENVSLETLRACPGYDEFEGRTAAYGAEFKNYQVGAILALISVAGNFYEECGAGLQMDAADSLLEAICQMLRETF